MRLVLIDAKYKGKIKLSKAALSELKKYKRIAVYTTTQFNHKLEECLGQLKKEGVDVVSSQPERTNAKFQILGCDIYHGNLKLRDDVDAYLYIGDGKFHPRALMFQEYDSGENKPIFTYDPTGNKLNVFDKKDIERVVKKEESNVKRFLMAKSVGILVTTKPGQEHFHYVKKLEEKFKDKKFYVFVGDTLDFGEFENFPFIKAWVNTACPRIGKEDILECEQALVNAETVLGL